MSGRPDNIHPAFHPVLTPPRKSKASLAALCSLLPQYHAKTWTHRILCPKGITTGTSAAMTTRERGASVQDAVNSPGERRFSMAKSPTQNGEFVVCQFAIACDTEIPGVTGNLIQRSENARCPSLARNSFTHRTAPPLHLARWNSPTH